MAARRIKPSRYISVDIEADGPIPGPYSMLSIGAAVAGVQDGDGFTAAAPEKHTFHRELRPIGEEFVPEALAVRAVAKGTMPRELLSRRRHTHHALDDAVEQAELFANLMEWQGPGSPR